MKPEKRLLDLWMSWKLHCLNVKCGERNSISPLGTFHLTEGSQITLGSDILLGRSYRISAHQGARIEIGSSVHFAEGARLFADRGASIIIDEGCSFNEHATIVALNSIRIGSNSLFGPYVYLSDHNHGLSRGCLIKDQDYETEPLCIGSDVWMGVGATLVKGAQVGEGAVIAARAVITRPVPSYEIWGGIPARRISCRR